MARYTAAPSSYTDPVVGTSPPNPWPSSLSGCGSCGLGAVELADKKLIFAVAGATIGYFAAPKTKHGFYVAGGFIAGLLLA